MGVNEAAETPRNDEILKAIETPPKGLERNDVHVWRRHLEEVQDRMLKNGLDFVENKEYAAEEALAHTKTELRGETDQLTGLKNRRGLHRALDELSRNRELSDRQIVIVRADANGLKQVNDSRGHKEGDRYLQAIGSALKMQGGESIVARDGGDEFAIVLIDSDLNGSTDFWKRFSEELPPEISIVGGATELDLENRETSMHQADLVMYEAKRRSKGGNQRNFFLTTQDFQPKETEDVTGTT